METIANYIGGALRSPASGSYLDVIEPATGRVYAKVPSSGPEDLEAAVEAARGAFPAWSRTPAADRARHLLALADALESRLESLARAESVDTGKPVALARRLDIPRAAANLRFFAAAATQFASESHFMESGAVNYTLRQPHGIVATISPWNLPLYLFTWKIAPALASGNTVIAKPSELTPMTAYLFTEICRDLGLPPGVLNVLHGEGPRVGQAIVEHPAIEAVSFTGGTATGRAIAAAAAPRFKKLSLELGGKNPTIVFADCDRDKAVEGCLRAAFTNQGEVCLCGSRIFVEASIYEAFRDVLVDLVRSLRVGDPLEESTEQGALVTSAHRDKVLGYLDLAREEGGRVLTGGRRAVVDSVRCRGGFFVEPTLIEGLGPSCRVNREEIFGPVATLLPFETEEDVLEAANATDYGLSASIWSADVSRCHRLAARLDAGLVWVNTWMLRDLRTPMGGMKRSGVGREGGFEAMRFFTEPKNVCVSYA